MSEDEEVSLNGSKIHQVITRVFFYREKRRRMIMNQPAEKVARRCPVI